MPSPCLSMQGSRRKNANYYAWTGTKRILALDENKGSDPLLPYTQIRMAVFCTSVINYASHVFTACKDSFGLVLLLALASAKGVVNCTTSFFEPVRTGLVQMGADTAPSPKVTERPHFMQL